MIIVLLGPPGSGKGTQANLLASKYHIPHISTGDILRVAVKEGTKLGLMVKEILNKGGLVPDNLMIGLIGGRISQDDAQDGFILDGYPRTLAQAEALFDLLNESGSKLDAVILLELKDDVVIKRISGRRTCPDCNSVYHIYYNPPKRGELCDTCNMRLIQRNDEKKATVKRRLSAYHKQTEPLIEYYRNRGRIVEINGEQQIEQIFKDIVEKLK